MGMASLGEISEHASQRAVSEISLATTKCPDTDWIVPHQSTVIQQQHPEPGRTRHCEILSHGSAGPVLAPDTEKQTQCWHAQDPWVARKLLAHDTLVSATLPAEHRRLQPLPLCPMPERTENLPVSDAGSCSSSAGATGQCTSIIAGARMQVLQMRDQLAALAAHRSRVEELVAARPAAVHAHQASPKVNGTIVGNGTVAQAGHEQGKGMSDMLTKSHASLMQVAAGQLASYRGAVSIDEATDTDPCVEAFMVRELFAQLAVDAKAHASSGGLLEPSAGFALGEQPRLDPVPDLGTKAAKATSSNTPLLWTTPCRTIFAR